MVQNAQNGVSWSETKKQAGISLRAKTAPAMQAAFWTAKKVNVKQVFTELKQRGIIRDNVKNVSLNHINDFLSGRLSFENVKADYALCYWDAVRSNKNWKWSADILGGEFLTTKHKSKIREYAINKGYLPKIRIFTESVVTPSGIKKYRFCAFHECEDLIVTIDLPESMWKLSDEEQFKWLYGQIGGEIEGTTWNHSYQTGKMDLMPTGIHMMYFHNGGRSPGMWSHAPRR